MTKSECYACISQNQETIRACYSAISTLNTEISELGQSKGVFEELGSTLTQCKNTSVLKLGENTEVNGINSKIVRNFTSKMESDIHGESFTSVYNGFGMGISSIDTTIANKNGEINNLNAQIEQCNNTISAMYAEIRRIEEQERAEAEAAARSSKKAVTAK